MQFTPEDKEIGQGNFNAAVGATRRDFLAGTIAAGAATGATYFGYKKLDGDRVKVGFIGTGDEGSVLLTEHPDEFMEIVASQICAPTIENELLLVTTTTFELA